MNKKAATFSLWTEVIIFLVLFLGVMAIIGISMNEDYDNNYDLTLGLNLSTQTTELIKLKGEVVNDTTQGQVEMTDFGVLKLMSTPKILLNVASMLWTFFSGGFINNLIMAMNLGAYSSLLIFVFKTLYIVAVAYILIKLVLRITA